MTIFIFCLLSLTTYDVYEQTKFSTNKGVISFKSNADLELISGYSENVRGLLDINSNQFAFTVNVNSFKGFNNELQREHFLEKYMEVDKYPTAYFNGKIIEQIDFEKEGTYEVRAKGDLNIHGVKQTRIIKGIINVKNGTVKLDCNFTIPLTDHNIEVPSIVNRKIATVIDVNFKASMIAK